MAGALVGGALLSAFLQVAFDRLASQKFLDFFRARKLDETLLGNLNITLLSIDALADDAELKQYRDPRVKAWLVAVRDAVFDAEDLLAEIDYKIIKRQVKAESQSHTFTYKVSNFCKPTFSSFNRKIGSEMKQVLDKLEHLAKQKGVLGLRSVGSGSKMSQKLPSTSLVVESVIYGRDEDKEMIFNCLTSESDSHNKLSVLSVVGMGGVGKTTLAQHVYNDPRMEAADFVIKAWVCVSDDFDVLRLTKAILETITKSKYDSGELEMVHGRLKEELKGKKFLLVLDDVWNERQEEWELIQTPLRYGAPGSRILVTTRSEKVASTMRSCKVHRLKQLEDDHCWQVFAKHAFQDDYPQLNAELKDIATKIVEKCKGLPLALKSIGSLLRTQSSISEWENVLKSELWDLPMGDSGIIPALLLSYHHLPSHLKRCFSFCALFPKDYEFEKERLIQFWMAQNFLQGPQQSRSPEELGEQYFDDLLSKSFFQKSSREERYFDDLLSKSFFQQSSRDNTLFVMHDLVNDLANYVCGDICFRLGVGKAKCVPKTTRHFSIASYDTEYFDVSESLPDAKRLRTFFPTTGREIFSDYWECKTSIHELFSKFKFLHVLSLSRCSDLGEVPDSLGELKHLRSLDLSGTDIKKLPDSTCLLYNLQILRLNSCQSLEELPMKLYKLTNLRCLEIEDTNVRRMPMHFGKLKNLQVLDVFCAGKSSEFSIRQIGGQNLHGRLSIKELQDIEDPSDALAGDLINKTRLEELELRWNRKHTLLDDSSSKEKEVLENLQPSKHLKYLSIWNYGGKQFASWLSNNSLSNLESLRLNDCKYCVRLPSLGLLPSLKKLRIEGLDGIVSIGAELFGTSSSPFPSLEKLSFFDMKEWEEWECTSSFPSLQSLSIEKCPKLKSLSEQLFHVKKLVIRDCVRLSIRGLNLEAMSLETSEHTVSNTCLDLNVNIPTTLCYDFLEELVINDTCHSLSTFPLDFFPRLCRLQLRGCGNLRMISQERTHTHIKELLIDKCHELESLPKRMDILLPSLTHLLIYDCPKVEMLSEGGLPSNLKSLNLSSYKLMASLKGSLGVNTCLERLVIGEMDEVECFPEEGILPLSLTSLTIRNFRNLKKLDYKGLCHLSSLKELRLYDCPKLECLPEEGLPKSISTLRIYGCPLLEERCQKPEGQDWPKIAHIQ